MSTQTWDPMDELPDDVERRLSKYAALLGDLNRKLNLVSRTTVDRIRDIHVRHSLCLTLRTFPAGAHVVDWGSGGGLPGIPLAIRFPDVRFHLVDAVGKKTRALSLLARELELPNVSVHNCRAEEFDVQVDYAVSRATADLDVLWAWTRRVIAPGARHVGELEWGPGLVCLKGGDLSGELLALSARETKVDVAVTDLGALTQRADFNEKWIVHVSAHGVDS